MFRLVIVDDEKMIRTGLVNTIPWSELRIEVVGTAANGQAALEVIHATKPHIVLTDIQMPKLDGLELTRILHEDFPEIRVVIISGYEEFAYAKKALQYQVVDYILKPVGAAALYQVMQKLVATLQTTFQSEVALVDLKTTFRVEIDQYLNLLKTGQTTSCLRALETLLGQFEEKNLPFGQFKKFALELGAQVRDHLKNAGLNPEDIAATDLTTLPLLNTLPELKQWLRQFSTQAISLLSQTTDSHNHQAIKKALEYINAHFQEELSINLVAEQVYLSPSYFSHIFKKIHGASFTDYLNAVRIAKAKELLKEQRYKVYEVADLVGYRDYKYFSSVFKKNTGISPTDYSGLE